MVSTDNGWGQPGNSQDTHGVKSGFNFYCGILIEVRRGMTLLKWQKSGKGRKGKMRKTEHARVAWVCPFIPLAFTKLHHRPGWRCGSWCLQYARNHFEEWGAAWSVQYNMGTKKKRSVGRCSLAYKGRYYCCSPCIVCAC